MNLFTISFHFLFITFSQVLKEKYYRYFLIRTGEPFKQNVHCGVLIFTIWSSTSDQRQTYLPIFRTRLPLRAVKFAYSGDIPKIFALYLSILYNVVGPPCLSINVIIKPDFAARKENPVWSEASVTQDTT